jgi:hypothetical protein
VDDVIFETRAAPVRLVKSAIEQSAAMPAGFAGLPWLDAGESGGRSFGGTAVRRGTRS